MIICNFFWGQGKSYIKRCRKCLSLTYMGSVTMKNYSQNVSILFVATAIVFASITATCGFSATIPKDISTAVLIRVEKYGRGDFRTIQEAIDSVPANNSELVFISVAPGIYRWVINRYISPFIYFQLNFVGFNSWNSLHNFFYMFTCAWPYICREKIIVPANKPFITISGTKASRTKITWSDGGSILDSATLTVLASHFVARSLTIQVRICVAYMMKSLIASYHLRI